MQSDDPQEHTIVRYLKITTHTLLKSIIFGVFFTLLVSISLISYIYYQVNYTYKNRILPNVYVNKIDLSGLDQNATKSIVDSQNERLNTLSTIFIEYPNGRIATFSAQMLDLKYESTSFFDQAYKIGRPLNSLDNFISSVLQIILKNKQQVIVSPEYSLFPVQSDLESMQNQLTTEPIDALFTVVNGKVEAFKIDTPGTTIDTASALSRVKSHFQKDPESILSPLYITVEAELIKPKVTIDEANDFGIVEEIGRGVSDFAHSAAARIHNIKLVSSRINGVLVPKGETFSFNKSVGEISAQTGYQSGYAIISGQTVLSDGGGVCQESTTIFRAVLNTGLPIVQWKNHSYRVRYYENDSKPGFDATVYSPSVDFKFKNDTPAHILIQSEISNGTILTVTLFGKSDGRVASVSASRVWDVAPPPEPLYKDDPTLPLGTTKQVDFPAWGAKAAFDYKVTRGDEVLQERTFTSVYRPWQAVFLVGKGQ